MGKWKYLGFTRTGEKHAGEFFAKDEREARKYLRNKGIKAKTLTPPSILEFDIGEWIADKGFVRPFGAKELAQFTKQMAIMVNAGVPIITTLEILFKSQKNVALKRTIKSVANEIAEGKKHC